MKSAVITRSVAAKDVFKETRPRRSVLATLRRMLGVPRAWCVQTNQRMLMGCPSVDNSMRLVRLEIHVKKPPTAKPNDALPVRLSGHRDRVSAIRKQVRAALDRKSVPMTRLLTMAFQSASPRFFCLWVRTAPLTTNATRVDATMACDFLEHLECAPAIPLPTLVVMMVWCAQTNLHTLMDCRNVKHPMRPGRLETSVRRTPTAKPNAASAVSLLLHRACVSAIPQPTRAAAAAKCVPTMPLPRTVYPSARAVKSRSVTWRASVLLLAELPAKECAYQGTLRHAYLLLHFL